MDGLIEIRPIHEADLRAAAEFLSKEMPPPPYRSTDSWVRFLSRNWASDRPNYGFMLTDSGRVVGVLGAIYSDQPVAGKKERFCNLTSWYVLPAWRVQSAKLLLACVSQPGYQFTNFTPSKIVQGVSSFMKFNVLDDLTYVIPAVPWDVAAKWASVTEAPEKLDERLEGDCRQIYADHRNVRRLYHLVAGPPGHRLYAAYRRSTVGGLPSARILMVSSPELFSNYLPAIRRFLLLRRAILFVVAESRFLAEPPRISIQRKLSMVRMSRTNLPNDRRALIHELYSELVSALDD